ncbi:MAG: bioH, partial [Acidobacteria bacterium]|nr:bioH [Acidobacteriota bacterium]
RYAAVRPERVRALVLASAIGPRWRLNDVERRWASSPWLSLPAFAAGAPFRLWPEIRAACPGPLRACAAAARYLGLVAAAPTLPSHLANRVRCLDGHDLAGDARAVRAPALVITGERDLDRVVPVDGTLEYVDLIAGASQRTLPGTGHIGLVTKPREFAALIAGFAAGLPATSRA